MPLLSYTASTFPFTPFTKILSADVVQCFNDVKTLLNTTKLDSTNVQSGGLTVDRLSISGGAAGQFIGSNGSTVVYVSNPLTAQFNIIVGSAAQVTAGTATYSSLVTAIAAASAGDRILILPAYATTENVTINKKLYIQGLGHTSVITGTVTFATSSDYSSLQSCRVTDTITLNSTVTGVIVSNIWLATGKSFTDNSTASLLTAIQE